MTDGNVDVQGTGVAEEAPPPETEPGAEAGPTTAPEEERKPETVKEWLRYRFTPEERETLGNIMADGHVKYAALEAELETLRAQFKSDMTRLKGEIGDAAQKLHAGYEMRTIECRVDRDYDRKVIVITRLDTWEVVKERLMTMEELQMEMF